VTTQEAQQRFDKVKAEFDKVSSESGGVTTAREADASDSDDDEVDAALERCLLPRALQLILWRAHAREACARF